MKKILSVMALTALFLSGCIKNDDTFRKELERVAPGLNIYDAARKQTDFSMQPANAAFRLGILLAEADKQAAADGEEVDFQKITYKDKNVKDALFGSMTKIEKSGDAGDYRITYNDNTQLFGFYFKGSLIVKTGNVPLADTNTNNDTAWTVEYDGFKVISVSNYGTWTSVVEFNDGETRLYANGDGSYTVGLANMDLNVENSQIHSDWSGSYRLRPEANGIAYSDCAGQNFSVTGNFSGPMLMALDKTSTTQPTKASYKLSNGVYRFGGQIFSGTVVCRLTGYGEYDESYYVSPEVTVTITFDANSNRFRQTIEYNGHIFE